MKLQDILFSQGFGTRYDCARMVEAGVVSVGDEVITDPNAELDVDGLVLTVRGEIWPYCEHAIIALNKPAGYECSLKPSANPSVMSMIPSPLRKRNVQPVGRLDVDTTGLLLLTDDGALLHRLIHPKHHVAKRYVVTCQHPVKESMLKQLLDGVMLVDEKKPVAAAEVKPIDEYTFEMVLTQGKYHQVKRMVAACANRVEKLHRVSVGNFTLPATLPEGQWMWIKQSDIL